MHLVGVCPDSVISRVTVSPTSDGNLREADARAVPSYSIVLMVN